jgi:hypothetical protein
MAMVLVRGLSYLVSMCRYMSLGYERTAVAQLLLTILRLFLGRLYPMLQRSAMIEPPMRSAAVD